MNPHLYLKKIFPFLLILQSINSFALEADTVLKRSNTKLNLEISGVSGTFEKQLSKKVTLVSELGMRTGNGLYLSSYDFAEGWKIYNLFVGLEGRYYYNLNKRLHEKKSVASNSANFLSLGVNYGFKPFISSEIIRRETFDINGQRFISEIPVEEYSLLSVSPSWGFQRKIGNHFSLESNFGLDFSYFSNDLNFVVGPAIGFRFGYIIE
ncbi:MAG TPA: hypothetical protein VGB63_09335 [Pedobacter sp.]|jgi:hypothetical protein